jgi:hypothetical protein
MSSRFSRGRSKRRPLSRSEAAVSRHFKERAFFEKGSAAADTMTFKNERVRKPLGIKRRSKDERDTEYGEPDETGPTVSEQGGQASGGAWREDH